MNSYSFPEHVPISDSAKGLITKILNLEPSKRPTLDEILQHPFINHGGTIPKLLPVSTIACPPSASYIKQFMPQESTVKVNLQPQRLIDTAPMGNQPSTKLANNQRSNLVSTDKVSLSKPQTPGANFGETQQFGQVTTNNFNMTGSTGTLRPQTVAQKDFKSTQSVKTLPGSFGSTGGMASTLTTFNKARSPGGTEIWVKKWVDYSSKYGLGYLLSNGATGVFFNDSSKIVLDPKGINFDYIERKPADKQDTVTSHTITEYPKDLQKKVTLLQHFRGYLEGEAKNIPIDDELTKKGSNVYVKKWMKTRHAVMFRLSNKIVQVNFTDKTEIILSSENKMVTFVNKKGERTNYPLATALESSNTEMAKRLKYTKEILTHMLNNNPQAGQTPGAVVDNYQLND